MILGEISEDEVRAGRPMLSSVAVGANGKAGSGFFVLAREFGRLDQTENESVFWKKELLAAYSAWAQAAATVELRSSVEAFLRGSREPQWASVRTSLTEFGLTTVAEEFVLRLTEVGHPEAMPGCSRSSRPKPTRAVRAGSPDCAGRGRTAVSDDFPTMEAITVY